MVNFFSKSSLLLWFPLSVFAQHDQGTWQEVLKSKSGTINATWYTSEPFIFRNSDGDLTGIEYDILVGFQSFLKEVYDVSLDVNWWENESFLDTYQTIKNSSASGIVGLSAFSTTPDRKKEVGFAPPYMSDISVLISSYDVPIVKNDQEFKSIFDKLTAITIEGTTYARDIDMLRKEYNLNFETCYIPSSENIQKAIEKTDGAFGFIDLPIYLTAFSHNSLKTVKRQNLFHMKREGYALIYPLGSDWEVPLRAYFTSSSFPGKRDEIVGKYIDRELYDFIKNVYSTANEDIILLTKEKELQNEALRGKIEEIEREEALRNYLIAGVVIVMLLLIVISWLYVIRHRTALLLHQQKEKIESQRRDIEVKKEQLEIHNEKLIELNEEKNNLIQILAHDLRAPINQVKGLAEILKMESDQLSQSHMDILNRMQAASAHLTGMISKILDVDYVDKQASGIPLEPIHLNNLICTVIDRYKAIANKKNIALTFVSESTPYVLADSVHLSQVFENIVSNAIKFSNKNKKVEIVVIPSEEDVDVKICDEGPGFTDEDKKHMFKKFQRLSATPTAEESSTGLGLSIVKKYIDLMNARITLKSTPGKGSMFIISLKKVNMENS